MDLGNILRVRQKHECEWDKSLGIAFDAKVGDTGFIPTQQKASAE